MGLFSSNTVKNDVSFFDDKFIKIQMAVNINDSFTLKNECTDEMYRFLMQCKADNVRSQYTNVVENVKIQNSFEADSFYDEDLDQDFVKINFQFWMSDYYIDNLGNVVSGYTKDPQFIEESWVFTSSNNRDWYLASIEE